MQRPLGSPLEMEGTYCNGNAAVDDDNNGKTKGRQRSFETCNFLAGIENNYTIKMLDICSFFASTEAGVASAAQNLGDGLGIAATAGTYVAFLSGMASLNKNITDLHEKIDRNREQAELRDAEAKHDRAKAELRDVEAKHDRAKAELRDAEAKVDRAEAKVDRVESRIKTESGEKKKATEELEKAITSLDNAKKALSDIQAVFPSVKNKLQADVLAAKHKVENLQRQEGYEAPSMV